MEMIVKTTTNVSLAVNIKKHSWDTLHVHKYSQMKKIMGLLMSSPYYEDLLPSTSKHKHSSRTSSSPVEQQAHPLNR